MKDNNGWLTTIWKTTSGGPGFIKRTMTKVFSALMQFSSILPVYSPLRTTTPWALSDIFKRSGNGRLAWYYLMNVELIVTIKATLRILLFTDLKSKLLKEGLECGRVGQH